MTEFLAQCVTNHPVATTLVALALIGALLWIAEKLGITNCF